ncbi:hypothetical protein BTVI_69660 [Pitangus sulphuratus]|nr:hypothetical protein BTVI_69660 [Pitangus sulphuratus]
MLCLMTSFGLQILNEWISKEYADEPGREEKYQQNLSSGHEESKFQAAQGIILSTDDKPMGSECSELEDHDGKNNQLPADPEIVWDLLLQLNHYKSMGPEGVHPRILKELADVIAKPLSMIFVLSWVSRGVPPNWKLDHTLWIFKKGKKEDPGNYRPVCLTSVADKVMEKIILGVNEKHLKDNTVTGIGYTDL